MKKIDITRIDFPDEQFDVVICTHIMEHIPDDRLAMREVRRVLRKGGKAIFDVSIGAKLTATFEDPSKTTEEERSEAFGQYDHIRIYAEGDYMERLKSVGFAVDPAGPHETAEDIRKYGLNAREKIFIVSK